MLRTISPIEREPARDPPAPHFGAEGRRFGYLQIRRILVVCLGNVCRSPMVEFVLRERLADRGVTVESAGIGAFDGDPIDPYALAVLRQHRIDASGHTARRLDKSMIDQADLVLVMEAAHLDFIRRQIPSAAGKMFLLGRWLDGSDVPDPFGQSRETFESLYLSIERAVDSWCDLI